MVVIALLALVGFWLGGWAISCFLERVFGFWCDPIRCCIPIGHGFLPFWPIASLIVLIMHGIYMFRYGLFGASLGVPGRLWNMRGGEYGARLENPFAKIIAKDFIVIGCLLLVFVILMTCHGFGWWA
jgi:hypothetical protein